MDDDGSKSPPPKVPAEFLWKGTINMVDVAQISITAHEVSGIINYSFKVSEAIFY